MEDYFKWATSALGIEIHSSLFLSEISGGFERGIMTKERVGPDSGCLINVPFDSILTVDFAKSTCFMELLQTDILEDDLLSLLLLFEKFNQNEKSKWNEHIKLLPVQHHSIPNYTEEDLEVISGSNLYSIGKRWKTQIREDFNNLSMRKIENMAVCERFQSWWNFDNYLWALSTVWSRFITINRDGKCFRGMVPVVDLLNHDPRAQVGHTFSHNEDCLKVLNSQVFEAEHQVFLNYGPLGNEKLLMLYGFSLPNNPFSCVNVWAAIDPSSPNYVTKKEALALLGISDGEEPFQVTGVDLPFKLMAFLRILHFSSRGSPMPVDVLVTAAQSMLSEENEKEVCQVIHRTLSELIQAYPNSIEEDQACLNALTVNHGASQNELKFEAERIQLECDHFTVSENSGSSRNCLREEFVPSRFRQINSLTMIISEKKIIYSTLDMLQKYKESLN